MGCCGIGFGDWNEFTDRARPLWGLVRRPPSSGSRAFDEYRGEMLRRLEQEEREFREFLERARMARQRDELNQFMAERRARPQSEGRTL
jgi:Protein of unknown function (DUF2852)